jgi:SAM-dependent methyltransferase
MMSARGTANKAFFGRGPPPPPPPPPTSATSMSRAVPASLLLPAAATSAPGTSAAAAPPRLPDPRHTPQLETTHVHQVYDRIASQWAGTRYKPWPAVVQFLARHGTRAALVVELGCGNGKNLQACAGQCPQVIASDISLPLCEIAALQTPQADVHVADIVNLPLRSRVCDLAICIAVLHHLSSAERRRIAVEECARVLVPGGRALFLAWAQDQTHGASGHVFESQDVFVPFHQKMYLPGFASAFVPDASGVSVELGHGVVDEEKRSVVFQRYCHVFVRGELEALVEQGGFRVTSSFEDTGNWGVEAQLL